ncbi:MAG: hypothetical protein AAGH79_03165 [Bacteroidota bacterium]
MVREFIQYCTFSAQVTLGIGFLLWLVRYRSLPGTLQRMGPFLILSILTQFVSVYLSRQKIPNLFLLHYYTVLEWVCWAFFYAYLLHPARFFRTYWPLLTAIVTALLIANSIWLEPLDGFNSNAKTLVQLLLLGASISYFFQSFGRIDLSRPVPFALILINFAVLIYYSGSLFIFMFSKILNQYQVDFGQQRLFWAINGLLYVLFVLLILISIWKAAYRKTTS